MAIEDDLGVNMLAIGSVAGTVGVLNGLGKVVQQARVNAAIRERRRQAASMVHVSEWNNLVDRFNDLATDYQTMVGYRDHYYSEAKRMEGLYLQAHQAHVESEQNVQRACTSARQERARKEQLEDQLHQADAQIAVLTKEKDQYRENFLSARADLSFENRLMKIDLDSAQREVSELKAEIEALKKNQR